MVNVAITALGPVMSKTGRHLIILLRARLKTSVTLKAFILFGNEIKDSNFLPSNHILNPYV